SRSGASLRSGSGIWLPSCPAACGAKRSRSSKALRRKKSWRPSATAGASRRQMPGPKQIGEHTKPCSGVPSPSGRNGKLRSDSSAGRSSASANFIEGRKQMATAGNPLAQLVVRFVAESAPFVAGLQAAQDQTDKFASSFSNFAKTIAGATPFAAIAAGSFHAAEEFSSAESTIARLSGATGQALSELQGSFRSLFTQTTQSASELAEGFGRIQRESGATGAQLEALVLTNSNLARVTGQSLVPTIDQTQAALKAFGIAASEQPAKLDVLFSLSQKTGTSIGVLSSGLQSAAPVLKTIGLSFDQSAALLANFAEKGISTDKVVSALNVGLVKLAQDGVKQPEIALRNFVDRVTQAATPMDALNIVAETFGKRSGLFLADAARVGALNIANLTEVTRNSAGSINSTAEKTETLSEALTKLGHSADVALAPLGTPLVKALEESVKAAIPLLNAVGQLSGKIAEANPHLLELTASIIAAGPVLILAAKYFKEL